MEDIIDFLRVILIKLTFQACILPKFHITLFTVSCWLRYLSAIEAFNLLYQIEHHPFHLASFFECEMFIMAQLTWVKYFAAWSLHMAFNLINVIQFRW